MKTRSFIFVALVALLFSQAAFAGMYWEAETTMSGGAVGEPKTTFQKNYMKDYKMRTESDESIMILDMESGNMHQLNPKEKTYFTMNLNDMMEQMGPMKEMMENMMKDMKVEETDETEKIAGYKCKKVNINMMGMNISSWVTDEVPGFKKYYDNMKKLAEKYAANPMIKNMMSPAMEKVKGFTMKTESNVMGMKNVMTVKKVEEKDISDDKFEIPKDYKKVESPSMPMMGGPTQ